jgi:hypothetical protein
VSRVELGQAVLLVPDHAGRQIETTTMTGDPRRGVETAAVVASADGQTLLEVAHHRWEEGGKVVALNRGESPPAYDRLLHGARLGVQARGDGTDMVEAGLLAWDKTKGAQGWGNPKQALLEHLDRLIGGSAAAVLVGAGAYDIGTRAAVFGDTSKRRNWLCVLCPAGDPVVPLMTYALTRVLPILRAGEAS